MHSKHINTSILTKLFLAATLLFTACGQKNGTAADPAAQEQAGENVPLPVLGEKKIVDGLEVPHSVRPFSFTDQDGRPFTDKQLKGKIYVADFFFTTCPSICPKMTGNMKLAYEAFRNDSNVFFVSHTIDPEFDTPEVLKQYARDKAYDEPRWRFLTGDKDSIYTICEEDYMAHAAPSDKEPGGYIHSGFLVLVDGRGQLRGAYDGTVQGKAEDLIRDIHKLKKEASQ